MFDRIGKSLALQFTLFVFALFMINGAVFLIADFGNMRRMASGRIFRETQMIVGRLPQTLSDGGASLPPHMRSRVRIVDAKGNALFTGALFTDLPFSSARGSSQATIGDEQYQILTTPVINQGRVQGYVQIAERPRFDVGDLPPRALVYIFVSLFVSGLTYGVGRFFARRSLSPAKEMFHRLEQFTQDASHELRTPLAILNSSLDVALKTGKHREGLLSAKDDVKGITGLVERMLELARLDKFELQNSLVDLSGLCGDLAEKFREPCQEKALTLTTAIVPDISVSADPLLLKQVITNLLTNAVKFTPTGGTVSLTLTKQACTVADTGIGIAQKDLPHIFDRFYQAETSRSEGGYGLGLALVKRIVDLHGWTITAKSQPGTGSTFIVIFARKSAASK